MTKDRTASEITKWVRIPGTGRRKGGDAADRAVEWLAAKPATFAIAAIAAIALAATYGYLGEWPVWVAVAALLAMCVALAKQGGVAADGRARVTEADEKKHNGLPSSMVYFDGAFRRSYAEALEGAGAVDRGLTVALYRAVGDALIELDVVRHSGMTRTYGGGEVAERVGVCRFAAEARANACFVLVDPTVALAEASRRFDGDAMRRVMRDCGLAGWAAEVAATDGDARLWRLAPARGYELGV